MPPRKKQTLEDRKGILWRAADKLRGSLDAAGYKHFVLGLVFLKYVSAAMAEKRQQLEAELRAEGGWDEADLLETLDERREYTGASVYYVPPAARWESVVDRARGVGRGAGIGEAIDSAMRAIEGHNPALRGTLPKIYGDSHVDGRRLADLVELLDRLVFQEQAGDGGGRRSARDVMGEVYEYFLAQFAMFEGRRGGEFFTPASVVQLLVEVLGPRQGERVYDPACGSGGMLVQAANSVQTHGGNPLDVAVYGQEQNATTWRLAHMNLAIHGVEANLGDGPADTFRDDQHPALKADVVLAAPPFNLFDWGGDFLAMDRRWVYGTPPVNNANYAWLQHTASKLAPGGRAGVVLANGSLSSRQSGEGDIRRAMLEADLVACVIALPGQLFRSTSIPACVWFLAGGKGRGSGWARGRGGEVLFVDARELGFMESRTLRALPGEEIVRIGDRVRAWRGEPGTGRYEDEPGFCASVPLSDIAAQDYALVPGRYVGTTKAAADPDGETPEARVARLTALLREQFAESARLAQVVDEQLRRVS